MDQDVPLYVMATAGTVLAPAPFAACRKMHERFQFVRMVSSQCCMAAIFLCRSLEGKGIISINANEYGQYSPVSTVHSILISV